MSDRVETTITTGDGGVGASTPVCVTKPADYKSGRKPVWCPGCGDYGVINSLTMGLAEVGVDPERLVVVSGIGCSSRLPGYLRAYGIHGAHGRAVPVAIGVKVARPELTVMIVGGDGDGFSIGGGHLPHAVRRNTDVTYVVMDNEIYGLTKGQVSPTSPTRARSKSAPYGTVESPINPMMLMLSYGATYAARGYASQPKELAQLIADGIRHKGFSFIHVLSPCVTFNKAAGYDFFKERVTPIPSEHRSDDFFGAVHLANDPERFYTGVFYRIERPEYTESLVRLGGRSVNPPPIDVEALIHKYS